MSSQLEENQQSAQLFGGNATYVEALYESYLEDPASVAEPWRDYFDSLRQFPGSDLAHTPVLEKFRNLKPNGAAHQPGGGTVNEAAEKHYRILRMINAYRARGHLQANLDPLGLSPRPDVPDLDPGFYQFDESDLGSVFNTGSLKIDKTKPLREAVAFLQRVYCGSIGTEYRHISDIHQRTWIQERLEEAAGDFGYDTTKRIRILERLTAAEGLEKYLHTKYVGQKRFSLEGGEALIPMLSELVQRSGSQGIKEMVFGMAHRGRLNALINILGKSPKDLFEEFEGKVEDENPYRSGDVKYHMGFSSDIETPGGTVHLAMGFNPSHLEIIDPVVAGSVRARQMRRTDFQHKEVMPVLIHGDAAVAGQGVVMELFNMSQARGFNVGGTLHIVINNQIGFTTSNPLDARSTLYCTEVAKMVQAPIFHVNGDDPEAVVFTMELASDFRLKFKKDVVVDLVCYRRHGHNEADEPAATQPIMYQTIRSMPTVRQKYADSLLAQGVLEPGQDKEISIEYRDALDHGEPVHEVNHESHASELTADWSPFIGGVLTDEIDTRISTEKLNELHHKLHDMPDGLQLHNRVVRIVEDRRKMAEGELPCDWGFAETLAYASLLDEGYTLRLVGQDSGRGTFFHRHAELHDQNTREVYTPLAAMASEPHRSTIINSLLSEEAVLGFEYGYASASPNALVIWEAQFGDFVNGAQVVIDQFITSGEAKWGRLCGLVMFLPHGFEGQGPEHSSARLERFLQLCANDNIQVVTPTTPAQMFHMLRRQMRRRCRKPLIVMTPKSMLRNKASTSTLEAIANGRFQNLIPDRYVSQLDEVERIVVCSGKVYYDLIAEREARKLHHIPILRVEQLYPFPRDALTLELAKYGEATQVAWCQEEPMNQGPWYQIRHHLQYCLGEQHKLYYAGREGSSSPAVGLYSKHLEQQKGLVNDALVNNAGLVA